MAKPPKHRVTNYFTSKELDLQTSEGRVKDEFKAIFELVGEKVIVKAGKLKTPPFVIEKIEIGFEEGLGKVFYLISKKGSNSIPVKVPNKMVESPKGLELIYLNKALDDKEILFRLSRSDKMLRDDSRIEIIFA